MSYAVIDGFRIIAYFPNTTFEAYQKDDNIANITPKV